jgi:hypothetical protein
MVSVRRHPWRRTLMTHTGLESMLHVRSLRKRLISAVWLTQWTCGAPMKHYADKP